MPRPCAVVIYAGSYTKRVLISRRCHGLAPWSITLVATRREFLSQAQCHGLAPWSFTLVATRREFLSQGDATAWRRGTSRWQLLEESSHLEGMPRPGAVVPHAGSYSKRVPISRGCHGLAPWYFTLTARSQSFEPSSNVILHGASPWHHHEGNQSFFVAAARESPRGKPVASS